MPFHPSSPGSSSSDPLDFIGLHLDPAARQPWGASSRPDEEAMEREEARQSAECGVRSAEWERQDCASERRGECGVGSGRQDGEERRWGWLLEDVMVYLFADGRPGSPRLVALRALLFFRAVLPGMLGASQRRPLEWDETDAAGLGQSFDFSAFRDLLAGEEGWETALRKMMGHVYPATGKGWLMRGTRGMYVVARAYNSSLVASSDKLSRDGLREREEELSFSDLAAVFEEEDKACRARWSALAKRLIRSPIEAAGGRAQLAFGKSASTCRKYRAAQIGNTNRRSGGASA